MSTEFEYMIIEKKPKTNVYQVNAKSTGNRLGEIKYKPTWRQYCFFPDTGTLYSAGCMDDLIKFIRNLHKSLVAVRGCRAIKAVSNEQ